MTRREMLDDLATVPVKVLGIVEDLLLMELDEARLELESAPDSVSVFRSQGKCAAIRNLMKQIRQVKGYGSAGI